MNTDLIIRTTYGEGNYSGDIYFVAIEQVPYPSETADLGEVAELLDELYSLEPCAVAAEPAEDAVTPSPFDLTTGQPQDRFGAPITLEQFQALIAKYLPTTSCDITVNNDYSTSVKVWVSDLKEDHRLVLTNGSFEPPTLVTESISEKITVEGATSTRLKHPLFAVKGKEPVFEWNTLLPHEVGGTSITLDEDKETLRWDATCTGTILATYTTKYYLYNILVYATDTGEYGECKAIAFFHGLTDDTDIQEPDTKKIEESDRDNYCDDNINSHIINTGKDHNVTCYLEETVERKCDCSGSTKDKITKLVKTACPEGIRCPGNGDDIETCSVVVGQSFSYQYVDCDETTQDISDPAFYLEKCCYAPEFGLPKCSSVMRSNPGGKSLSEEDKKFYTDTYGEGRVNFVGITPEDGDCGTTTTEQKLTALSCCDEVPSDVVIDEESTADILPPDSSILVYMSGGQYPYTFKTSAANTYFSNGKRTIVTDNPYVKLYGGTFFCGGTSVSVTDGCSTDSTLVKSTEGQWVVVGSECQFKGAVGEYSTTPVEGVTGGVTGYTYTVGVHRVVEQFEPRSSYLTGNYYVGGIFDSDVAPQICPMGTEAGSSFSVCYNLEKTLLETHCDCATALGAGPGTYEGGGTCLSEESAGIPPYSCGDTSVTYSGALSIRCEVPNLSGSIGGYVLSWYDTERIYNLMWTC